MKTVQQLMAKKRVGLLSAHPDDHLIHTHALELVRQTGGEIHELMLTLGRASTINYRRQKNFSVPRGDRIHEARVAAPLLGIVSLEPSDLPDGELSKYTGDAVPIVAEWIARRQIEVLLTLGGLRDHSDHQATGPIGSLAAAAALGRQAHVLDVHADGRGSLVVEATPSGMERAYMAARAHASQFHTSYNLDSGWPITPSGHAMHPDSASGLDQYPLLYDATYSLRTHKAATPLPN